jgi:hypothetical protein
LEERIPMRRDTAEREESREELALRATLHTQSSEMVDTDVAWDLVAPRLTTSAAVVSQRRKAGPFAAVSRGLLVAASLAIVVALAGAGVGAAYWGGLFGGPKAQLIGDKQLYTEIGQSQVVDGVTVSIDQAYADPGNIYLAVSFTMSHDMGSHYGQVIVNRTTIADTAGQEAKGLNMTCEPFWRDALFHRDSIQHCMMDAGPLQPATGATTLSLSVEIGEVWLFPTSGGEREVHPGPLRFQFTLPYHQQSLGPGGPYAEPGTTTPSTPGTKKP